MEKGDHWFDAIEPLVETLAPGDPPPVEMLLASMAISLKRIADNMEKLAHPAFIVGSPIASDAFVGDVSDLVFGKQ